MTEIETSLEFMVGLSSEYIKSFDPPIISTKPYRPTELHVGRGGKSLGKLTEKPFRRPEKIELGYFSIEVEHPRTPTSDD